MKYFSLSNFKWLIFILHFLILIQQVSADSSNDLLDAVKTRNAKKVSDALENGADPNTKLNGNRPILLIAVENGDLEITKALLVKGAKVNSFETTKENPGWTALMHAAESGRMDLIQLLIAKGANKKQKNGKGYDAIYLAELWGNSEVAAYIGGKKLEEKKYLACEKILKNQKIKLKNIKTVENKEEG